MFDAFRIFQDGQAIHSRLSQVSLDEISPGDVVIEAAYSSVNYKDALAATGAGKIARRFPITGGIDVSGTVVSSESGSVPTGMKVLVTGYDMGVSHDGGYSQYVRVPSDWVVSLPNGLSLFDAMALGTAGLTAALSIIELERNGLTPADGPVIVTGATGGVGSMAVACLAAAGYEVSALTGKDSAHEYLRSLGAHNVIARGSLQMGTRPLEPATWAGAVDVVGGEVLAWLTRTMKYRGAIACSGLTGGTELRTTVMPFILRGVKLLGIDSAMCPISVRAEAWRRLATDLRPRDLGAMVQEIGWDDLPAAFETLLKGAARGRFVVKIGK